MRKASRSIGAERPKGHYEHARGEGLAEAFTVMGFVDAEI
jgi:hypothetical protein